MEPLLQYIIVCRSSQPYNSLDKFDPHFINRNLGSF
jgi:hypothetical protein